MPMSGSLEHSPVPIIWDLGIVPGSFSQSEWKKHE
jgi:hypothetical protein